MILAALERMVPLALMASLAAASGSAPAERLERWRWNSWERTRHGIEQLREGDAPAAAAALDTAARVSDHDPRALLNAGAAHLLAGDPTGALPWLEQAAALAPAPLAASAQYHLGTARLAAGTAPPASGTPSAASPQSTPSQQNPRSQQNLAGAIEALQEALRLQPDFSAAKHNLELALRAQERQKQQQQEQEKQQEKQQEQPSQRSRANEQTPGNDGRPAAETTPRPGQPDSQPSDSPDNKPQDNRPDQGEGGGRDQAPPSAAGERSLTPEQVRSLLAAVENLERQQRRQQGQQKLSRAASVEKDW